MQELLVLSGNPSRRKKRRASGGGKRRRSAAQRAATRKLVALMKGRRGGRKSRRSSRVASNPRRYRRRMITRVRRASRRAQRGFAIMGSRMGSLSKPFSIVAPALTGAIGAVAVQAILTRIPLPAMLMQGKVRFLTQGAAAIGLGILASKIKVVGGSTAAKMAEGALTVTLADAIRELASDAGIPLSGMGYYLPGIRARAVPNASGRPATQMGKYVSGPGANVMPLTMRRNGMSNVNRKF